MLADQIPSNIILVDMAQGHECGEQTFATPKIDICILLYLATHIFTKEDFVKNKWDKVWYYWELGEQIENKRHYLWALGGNMEKPCGTHLRTQN